MGHAADGGGERLRLWHAIARHRDRHRGIDRIGPVSGEGGRGGWPKVVVTAADDGLLLLLLLLELHGAHSANGLFSLDAFFFAGLKDLLVFYTEFTTLYIEAVEGSDDGICICGLAEVCESETSELT